jgi:uncharacterized protein (DUF488 family)
MTEREFFTIGHSTHPLGEFLGLLLAHDIEALADVRRFPRSRTNPQFNAETLEPALRDSGIAYRHFAELGGRRPHAKDVDASLNAFWENESFHNYADYALSSEFASGLQELVAFGDAHRCCVMCSETLWWRCHRRIIADYLEALGAHVFHISAEGRIDKAALSEAARPSGNGTLLYPPLSH